MKKATLLKNIYFLALKFRKCVILRQIFEDDLFFVLFHIISAFYIAFGTALPDIDTFLYISGVCDKV